MRFIVSPAKKMNVVDDAFGWRDLPMFADRAARLADAVRAVEREPLPAVERAYDAPADEPAENPIDFEALRRVWSGRQPTRRKTA